jgi:ABC-type transport system involved in multi-copper enzyme maturation permease subunit
MLTHPLKRWEYLIGRYIGTVISIALGMVLMMILHLVLLYVIGWRWQNFYIIAWLCSLGKVVVMSAVALLISLLTTSAVTSMSFTVLVWILGHFSEELKFLGGKSTNVLIKLITWIIYNITPNFSYYNYRDFWTAVQTPPPIWFGWMAVYTVAYTGMCLIFSNFLFSQKEF